ncbi:MAG: family 20 glycosylhydrolase [Phycisphaerales bacterium]|nr:family 20 glycosylhydrolase [Phycisphaerales bacterium]
MTSARDLAAILLPTPRSLVRREGSLSLDAAGKAALAALADPAFACTPGQSLGPVRFVHQPGLAPEAYRLIIDDAVRIAAATPVGLRLGAHTLVQIARLHPQALPKLEINDEPSFAHRGAMLDVSRDRVPTMAHLRHTIDLLASLKVNHLQLYTEHTFAYAGHEAAWADASPLTPAEVRELDAYAAARGVELAPNQNCFGHLAHWLKLPQYQHLAEIEGDGSWMFLFFERRGPFSLCPTLPESERFVDDLLSQLVPNFSSRLVNIGCDETFDVGFGRSKPWVERRAAELGGSDIARNRARVELYFQFVAKIAASCARLGRRPMMWGDIAVSHPERLGLMPDGMIGLAWWYEPTDRFGPWVESLREHGHEAWVCPGTSSWRSFTGRTTERRGNIADAAEQGARTGATGFLTCDWGDLGHRQQWPVSLIGLAHGAHAAWNANAARAFDARAASAHVFSDPSLTLGPWLETLGDADRPIREKHALTNATALFNDLHPPVPAVVEPGKRAIAAPREEWLPVRGTLEMLASSLPTVTNPLLDRELRHTLRVATFAADHAIAHRRPGGLAAADRSQLRDELSQVIVEHEELWLTRSRPGGLPHATGFYRTVLDGLSVAVG